MLFPDGAQLIKKKKKKIMQISVVHVFTLLATMFFHLYPLFEYNKLMSVNWRHGLQMVQSCLFTRTCPLPQGIAL